MFSINTKALREAFGVAARYASPKSNLECLTTVRLKALEEGLLELEATNLEQGVVVRIPEIPVTQPGATCIPAKMMSEILATWGDQLNAEYDERTATLSVNGSGGAKARIRCLDKDEFPKVDSTMNGAETKNSFAVDATVFKEAVARVAKFASQDETRPVLTSVHCLVKDGKLRLEAADGFRLAVDEIEITPSGDEDPKIDVLIPAKAMLDAAKYAGPDPVGFSFNYGKVFFRMSENLEIISALIDGKYPDIEQIIPRGALLVIHFKTEDMRRAIRRGSIFSNISTHSITLTVDADARLLKIAAKSEELGSFEDEIEIDLIDNSIPVQNDEEGNPIKANFRIAFNSRYLSDTLLNCETTRIEFTQPNTPAALMSPYTPDHWVGVLMPMMLTD